MSHTIITFPEKQITNSLGRNGLIKTTGIEVGFTVTGTVTLMPVTSKGIISESCILEIPAESLKELCDSLTKLLGPEKYT